jgi:hypothetical protein
VWKDWDRAILATTPGPVTLLPPLRAAAVA